MAEARRTRRRFLLGLGTLAAGSATVATWPSRLPGTPAVHADGPPVPVSTGMGAPSRRGTQSVVSSAASREADDRPNVIVILADDVGWGEVGAYGQRKMKT